jgi:hypothetical protein
MKRRDFLRLRVRGDERVLELSCERLYMAYVDAESAAATGPRDGPADLPWAGEPPTEIGLQTTTEVFAELDRRLAVADALYMVATDWLSDAGFRARVERAVEAFRRRGGRVERSGQATAAS